MATFIGTKWPSQVLIILTRVNGDAVGRPFSLIKSHAERFGCRRRVAARRHGGLFYVYEGGRVWQMAAGMRHLGGSGMMISHD